MNFGLTKVFTSLGKEAGLSRACARVDSLGLAKRRLAAKIAQEEQYLEEQDAGQQQVANNERDALPHPEGQSEEDDTEAILINLTSRQQRDSLRVHRRRLRQRASLELTSSRLRNSVRGRGGSWSSGASGSGEAGDGDDDEEEAAEGGSAHPAGSRHVRFRRASDGEYLSRSQPTPKQLEATVPSALRAVQLRAERLFKRLTAPFAEHPPRPRSTTTSRGGSPSRPRTSNSRGGSTSRHSAPWSLSLRHRSVDSRVDSSAAVTSASLSISPMSGAAPHPPSGGSADGRPSPSGGRRSKRKSAPGELDGRRPAGSCTDAAGLLPRPTSGAAAREASSPHPSPAGGISRGRNWLARISRGLTGGAAAAAAAAGSGGGSAASSPAGAYQGQPGAVVAASPPASPRLTPRSGSRTPSRPNLGAGGSSGCPSPVAAQARGCSAPAAREVSGAGGTTAVAAGGGAAVAEAAVEAEIVTAGEPSSVVEVKAAE